MFLYQIVIKWLVYAMLLLFFRISMKKKERKKERKKELSIEFSILFCYVFVTCPIYIYID